MLEYFSVFLPLNICDQLSIPEFHADDFVIIPSKYIFTVSTINLPLHCESLTGGNGLNQRICAMKNLHHKFFTASVVKPRAWHTTGISGEGGGVTQITVITDALQVKKRLFYWRRHLVVRITWPHHSKCVARFHRLLTLRAPMSTAARDILCFYLHLYNP